MRSKTNNLGMLALAITCMTFLSSGRPSNKRADIGFNPGEQLPSVEVNDVLWLSDLHFDSISYVVVWSKSDAVSRAVSSWLSRNATNTGVSFYSVCTDADQKDTKLFSHFDNLSTHTEIVGMLDENINNYDLRVLERNAKGHLFVLKQGIIQRVIPLGEVWSAISSGADLDWIND